MTDVQLLELRDIDGGLLLRCETSEEVRQDVREQIELALGKLESRELMALNEMGHALHLYATHLFVQFRREGHAEVGMQMAQVLEVLAGCIHNIDKMRPDELQ